MNWDQIGAIGQVLGSVAVLVTLGYLAVQVKLSRQDARRITARGLTLEEASALNLMELAIWQIRWPAIEGVDELSQGQRFELEGNIRYAYGGSGVSAAWYQSRKATLNREVVRYIDNLLAQPS